MDAPSVTPALEVTEPLRETTTPSEIALTTITDVVVPPSQDITPVLDLVVVTGAGEAGHSTLTTLTPDEASLGFKDHTFEDFTFRSEVLKDLALSSSLLRSGEIKLSMARGPLEKV